MEVSSVYKIGISFDGQKDSMTLFSNGIHQNALYFADLLHLLGHDVSFIIDRPLISDIYGFEYEKFPSVMYTDARSIKWDIVVQFGLVIDLETLVAIKKNGAKLVSYRCGNDYIIEMERVIFKGAHRDPDESDVLPQYSSLYKTKNSAVIFDEIWVIPQMANTNAKYLETYLRCPAVTVPFIWSPKSIEALSKKMAFSPKYTMRDGPKTIAIFEPNLNVFKYCLPSILVCENAYRECNDLISKVYITNVAGVKRFNLELFSSMLFSLDLYMDNKLFAEARYPTLMLMSSNADIAVSHQWENPLNYLYLDLAWMGWPVLHNAELCKDIGYYYEGFDYKQGGQMLCHIAKTHDINAAAYLEENRRKIDRYLPTNPTLQNSYRVLIENLLKK